MADNPIKALALALQATLAPACERIEIAGSIRRGKDTPKDIELVAIPYIQTIPIQDMFGPTDRTVSVNALDVLLDDYIGSNGWIFDPNLRRNGPLYKRLQHREIRNHEGKLVCCDLFLTTAAKWGCIFAIRTGPARYSEFVVTWAKHRGFQVKEGRLWRVDRAGREHEIDTPEEKDLFKALGLPYLSPHDRGLAQV